MRARTVVSSLSLVLVAGTFQASGRQFFPALPALTSTQARSMAMLRMIEGDTLRLRLMPDDPDSRNARIARETGPRTYRSSNPSVATIDENGLVRAVGLGTTTVTTTRVGRPSQPKVTTIEVITPQRSRMLAVAAICPNEDDRVLLDSVFITTSVSDIHEYHDCQRLVVDGKYASLVGILAHENVSTFDKWQQYANGRLAAVIVNFVGDKAPKPYDPLKLTPGTNCLIIRALSADVWEAGLKSQSTPVVTPGNGRHYDDCDDSLNWSNVDPGRTLSVKIQRQAFDPDGNQIAPPVARWDWDIRNNVNTIGVRCDLTTWCEIGLPTLAPTPARMYGRIKLYKGYYDEQHLADPTGTQVSSVLGYIVPAYHTRNVHAMKHGDGNWQRAATLTFVETAKSISPSFITYYRRYHSPGVTPNVRTFTSPLGLQPIDVSDPLSGYDGQLNGKSLLFGGVAFHNHHRRPATVATVRWRWYDKDERAWSYCDPHGCCENVDTLF